MGRKDNRRPLELLAPARDLPTAIAAIDHGADAVYMGGPGHGARAAATNSIDDIRRAAEYAHRFGARLYVTVNTLVYDSEIKDVESMIAQLYHAGVDALIVQDMGILKMDIPPIALHASTQCDTRTPEKARMLEDLGFSQIVLARELSLKEIAQVREATTVPLEVFVHGALCVSFSGDCQASFLATGRSANRGECSQMCRLSYDLVDGDGRVVNKAKHLLSLRDMNRISALEELAGAGASSFKIEGRLKDTAYVKNVTAAYSAALDRVVEMYPDVYRRSSYGHCRPAFVPDVAKAFNRGFTDYFLNGRPQCSTRMASPDTPKDSGLIIGTAGRRRGVSIEVRTHSGITLAPGDGLCFFDKQGALRGFRINKVEGSRIVAAPGASLPEEGTELRRNNDTAWEKQLSLPGERKIYVDGSLYPLPDGRLALRLDAEDGAYAVAATPEAVATGEAQSPQGRVRRDTIARMGGTPYSLNDLKDTTGEHTFIPLSAISSLKRSALDALDRSRRASYCRELRKASNPSAATQPRELTYHDNVANSLAASVYADAGIKGSAKALEVSPLPAGETRVMQTRYCLRREMGACLKEQTHAKLRGPLYLRRGKSAWRLDFDCAECRMNVIANPALPGNGDSHAEAVDKQKGGDVASE